jgi:hypothetical protein
VNWFRRKKPTPRFDPFGALMLHTIHEMNRAILMSTFAAALSVIESVGEAERCRQKAEHHRRMAERLRDRHPIQLPLP